MRISLGCLLVLGLASTISVNGGPTRQLYALHDDLDDFLALVPREKILAILNEYVLSDKEVQAAIDYILSDDFTELFLIIEHMEYVQTLIEYLDESGLDVYRILNVIHDFLGLAPASRVILSTQITGGVAGLIADIKAALPLEEIKALYHKKLETSIEFKKLVERLSSEEFQDVINAVFNLEAFNQLINKLNTFGVDIQKILDLLNSILGLEFPQNPGTIKRALHDDFLDFINLLPKDKILQIISEYVDSDEEFQFVMEYTQSAEFRQLVKIVEDIPDVIIFYNYLQESGLDVYGAVNQLHDFIGLPPLLPSTRPTIKITGGVSGLIADLKAILPIEDIKALYYKKLETSIEFKNLIERLQSPKFQAIIDILMANEEFNEILQQAKNRGVDIEAISNLFSTIFGLDFPAPNLRALHDDLEDFLALIPQAKVLAIVFEYLEKDQQVQWVVDYIKSTEFKELVVTVEKIPDVIKFYDYLQESGLNVYSLVNRLHSVIGLPPLVPIRSSHRITGGVTGLIADIKAILPLEDIKALYYEKLETSVEFKYMIERLQSPKFQAVIDTLVANKEFQEILSAAKQVGVDVKAVADLLSTVLGIEWPKSRMARDLQTDFDDFLVLLPFEDIAKIGFDYLLNDPEVQKAAEYVKSAEFRELIVKLQKDSEVHTFIKYLEDSGASIIDAFNLLNSLLGLPPYPESIYWDSVLRASGGVHAMLDEIRDILPHDKIKALYQDKLQTSKDFSYFIQRIKDKELQELVNVMVVNKNVIELGYQAQQHGISIERIVEFMGNLFGLSFPEPPWFPTEPPSSKHYPEMQDLSEYDSIDAE